MALYPRASFVDLADVVLGMRKNKDAEEVELLRRTAELSGFCDLTAGQAIEPREQGLERARQFNCRFYETPEQLVSDPEIDTMFVLTNLETHLYFTKMAFKAGKHVLCQEPVAASVGEAEELDDEAQRAGLLCMPGHNMIYEESLARSQDMIVSGALGKLVSVHVLYNILHSEERAATLPGIVRQILTHNSYTLVYLAGPPRRLSAFAASLHYTSLDKQDIAMVNLEMQSGAPGHMCTSFAADGLSTSPWAYTIKAIGTDGSTSYSYNDWVGGKEGHRPLTHLHGPPVHIRQRGAPVHPQRALRRRAAPLYPQGRHPVPTDDRGDRDLDRRGKGRGGVIGRVGIVLQKSR